MDAAPVPTKLDAYKAIIESRHAAYPALSAVGLLAEIRAAACDFLTTLELSRVVTFRRL
jgi:hypothetical protein